MIMKVLEVMIQVQVPVSDNLGLGRDILWSGLMSKGNETYRISLPFSLINLGKKIGYV